jgi:hypothetical protein
VLACTLTCPISAAATNQPLPIQTTYDSIIMTKTYLMAGFVEKMQSQDQDFRSVLETFYVRCTETFSE